VVVAVGPDPEPPPQATKNKAREVAAKDRIKKDWDENM
jgi:hypothetical protein